MQCETCIYFQYDCEYDDYICTMIWEEDVLAKSIQGFYKNCPYYRDEDEYKLVRAQK